MTNQSAAASDDALRANNANHLRAYLDRLGGGGPAFRLCLLLLVWSSSLAAVVPQSTIGHLLAEARFIGWIVFFLCLIGIVETLINDVLPERFHWNFALHYRHLALLFCAGFYLMLVYLLTQSNISRLVVPYFLIMAFFLVWHAFMDIIGRYGPENKQ